MVEFNIWDNCKICNQIGETIYLKSYEDIILKNFFKNYYGKNKYNELKHSLYKADYELLKCKKCKFIWQKYSPKEKLSFQLYENIIDKETSLNKSEIKFKKQNKKNYKEINKIINYFKNSKVNLLDFGAGWGHWLDSGDKSKYNSFAFELSPSRKKYLQSKKISILDLNNIKQYNNFFHYIRIDQVLEHLDEINSLLKMVKVLGNKDCIFFISVPDGSKIINNPKRLTIGKGPIQPLEHLNCFSRFSLSKLLDKHDFKCIEINKTLRINFKDFSFDKLSLKSMVYDLTNHFYSTTIKFVNK